MKILMVNKFLYPNGGSETYMFKLGEYLTSLGHQVEYFGMEHPDRCVSNSAQCYTKNMDFHNSSPVEKILFSQKTIYSFEARKKIRVVLETFKPDVVHLNNFNYQLTPSVIVEIRKWEKESKKDVRIIYTAHDYQLICPNHMLKNPNTCKICEKCIGNNFLNCVKGKCVHGSTLKSIIGATEAYYWNNRKIYKEIDKVICCSNFMKAKLDTNPVLREKTIALHNFIDIDNNIQAEKKDYFLYFGRFSQEKGINTLIEACKALPDVQFIFAGSGPLEESINGISNIKNVGFKSGNELKKLIAQATASIYPSTWYENCPLSVMESISLGTPVIGADIGGIPELVEDGKNGLLFKAGCTEELISRITSLKSDASLLAKLTSKCTGNSFLSLTEYTNEYCTVVE